ncbi:uncharacterized protein BO97DRAFT_310485, partial [Aspergillus homomorphus CBS 101889]
MANEERLALASIWGFEPIGVSGPTIHKSQSANANSVQVQEISEEVLSVKGSLDDYTTKIANVVSNTIAGQEYKDLLDLDMTSTLQGVGHVDEMNGPLDEGYELIPTSTIHITKFWLSSRGGLGCYSFESRNILSSIAELTTTEITMLDDTQGIQVSGTSAVDVDDALAKLSRVEKPLTCLQHPIMANMLVVSEDDGFRYRIQKYNTLNPIAQSRVLADPILGRYAVPGEMYVTVQFSLDKVTHSMGMPTNLKNPPHLVNDPGKSRIWNDFVFQPLGSGEGYHAVISMAESTIPGTRAMTIEEVSASLHPYLTAEKAKQVNQWVVEGARVERDVPETGSVAPDTAQAPVPKAFALVPRDVTGAAGAQKPTGVKVRRVAPAVSKPVSQAAPSATKPKSSSNGAPPVTEPRSPKSENPGLNEYELSPRKRWVMQYDIKNGEQNLQAPMSEAKAPGPQSQAQLSEDKSILPSTFDTTRYGLKSPSSLQRPWSRRGNPSFGSATRWKASRQNQLIDINVPVTAATSSQIISFDQPALLPSAFSSSADTTASFDKNTSDLAGLTIGPGSYLESSESGSGHGPTTPVNGSVAYQEERLGALREKYNATSREVISTSNAISNAPASRSQANEIWVKAMITDLERAQRSEKESSDEVASRKFHKTRHRAPKSASAAKSKAEAKARRQATLEDSWGIGKPKKKPTAASVEQNPAASSNMQASNVPKPAPVEDAAFKKQVKNLHDAIIPILDSAACFPGAMNIEMQLGLVLIPLLPMTYSQESMTLDGWTKLFRPPRGLFAPTTKFVTRLTTSGADIDHIVDIRTSKADGKRRLFEQDYTDYGVSYEYHFRTRSNKVYMVAIDENGSHSIREPGKALGGVNFHFPGHTWDARMSVSKATGFACDTNSDIEQIAQHLIKSIWIEPDKFLIRIYTRLPTEIENKVTLENVYMKRWTRHRHLQPGEAASASGPKAATVADKVCNDDGNATSHIFLQITEVQDLIHGKHPTEPEVKRARATPPADMVSNGRLWYEVALVSPAIDALLNSNADLEVGERSSDWRGIDLFGRDAAALLGGGGGGGGEHQKPSPVAKAIGHAGLGDLLSLAKTVIQRIDAVGFWN